MKGRMFLIVMEHAPVHDKTAERGGEVADVMAIRVISDCLNGAQLFEGTIDDLMYVQFGMEEFM